MTMEVTALGRLQPSRRKPTDRREMLQESVSSVWLIKALTDGQRGRLTSPRAKLTQSGRAHRHAGLLPLPMATLSGYSCKPGPLRVWLTIWVCPGLSRFLCWKSSILITSSVPGWPGRWVTWNHAIYGHVVEKQWKTNPEIGKLPPDQWHHLDFEKIYIICTL